MNPSNHPGAYEVPRNDVEKLEESKQNVSNIITTVGDALGHSFNLSSSDLPEQHDDLPTLVLFKGKLAEWNAKVEGLAGLEARGIRRVLPEETYSEGIRGYIRMFLLWFSINLVALNIIVGLIGPLVLSLAAWIASALSFLPIPFLVPALRISLQLGRKVETEMWYVCVQIEFQVSLRLLRIAGIH
ncbi:hypothetical protein MMC19_000820 [Ptychographa xylographoides]|nr:hypothetical protein [Ptychographa xylographoides]